MSSPVVRVYQYGPVINDTSSSYVTCSEQLAEIKREVYSYSQCFCYTFCVETNLFLFILLCYKSSTYQHLVGSCMIIKVFATQQSSSTDCMIV